MKRILFFVSAITLLFSGLQTRNQAALEYPVLFSVARMGQWIASPIVSDCVGPKDASSNYWYEPDFDDSAWQPVLLEDLNSIPPGSDRYYRTVLNIVGAPATTSIQLSSDDGLWMYVNGVSVGHWGGICHGSGLSSSRVVDITSYLHTGENIIAAHVTNGAVGSGFNAVVPWQISYSYDVQLTGKILSQPECSGEFGVASPASMVGDTNVEAHAGMSFTFPTYIPQNTPIRFYFKPVAPCAAGIYYSDDPRYAKLSKTAEGNWLIEWSDYPDWNYNHLKIELLAKQAAVPFLDLPFDYSSFSTFASAVSDTEKKGTVNAYFDHHYPNYGVDNNVVTFHGYESRSDDPGYKLAYDGHDGYDFVIHQEGVKVLAAATGIIHLYPEPSTGSVFCAATGKYVKQLLGNYVEIWHDNGYKTIYGHLASFNTASSAIDTDPIIDGQPVKQGQTIGLMGSTGCSTGPHIHFTVINPDGVKVDPFGWLAKQYPNSTYGKSSAPDPWADYNTKLQPPKNGTSTYLWDLPLVADQLNNPDGSAVVSSSSGNAQITFATASVPASAYRVVITEGPGVSNTLFPPGTPEGLFYYSIFGPNDEPIWTLSQPATFLFHLSDNASQQSQRSGSITSQSVSNPSYSAYVFNENANAWEKLETVLDPTDHTVTFYTNIVGQVIVLEDWKNLYLPTVIK